MSQEGEITEHGVGTDILIDTVLICYCMLCSDFSSALRDFRKDLPEKELVVLLEQGEVVV